MMARASVAGRPWVLAVVFQGRERRRGMFLSTAQVIDFFFFCYF